MAGLLNMSPVLLQLGCHRCGAVGCRERRGRVRGRKANDSEKRLYVVSSVREGGK